MTLFPVQLFFRYQDSAVISSLQGTSNSRTNGGKIDVRCRFHSKRPEKKSDVVAYPVLYQSLGRTDEERQVAYRELFRHELESGEIDISEKP